MCCWRWRGQIISITPKRTRGLPHTPNAAGRHVLSRSLDLSGFRPTRLIRAMRFRRRMPPRCSSNGRGMRRIVFGIHPPPIRPRFICGLWDINKSTTRGSSKSRGKIKDGWSRWTRICQRTRSKKIWWRQSLRNAKKEFTRNCFADIPLPAIHKSKIVNRKFPNAHHHFRL